MSALRSRRRIAAKLHKADRASDRLPAPLYDSRVAAADQAPTVLIMAAGEGTRMRSSLPKVLHPVCGRPTVSYTHLTLPTTPYV